MSIPYVAREDGLYRVTGTRISLDSLVLAYLMPSAVVVVTVIIVIVFEFVVVCSECVGILCLELLFHKHFVFEQLDFVPRPTASLSGHPAKQGLSSPTGATS